MTNESTLVDSAILFSWAAPMEILLIIFGSVGLISSILFISIVVTRRELRHDLNLILTANLSICGLVSCPSEISAGVYMLRNSGSDDLCPIRDYLWICGTLYIFQAAALQTLHRLFITVFVHRRRWQSHWLFGFIALTQLSACLLMPLPLLLNGNVQYIPVAKFCYTTFNDVFGIVYLATTLYLTPLTFQSLCSWWILRFISRQTGAVCAQINVKRRLSKEKRVLARLAFPVIILLILGLFYLVFVIGTILSGGSWKPPPYSFHLSFVGSSAAVGLVMVSNILLNKKVREMIYSIVPHRHNTVHVINQR